MKKEHLRIAMQRDTLRMGGRIKIFERNVQRRMRSYVLLARKQNIRPQEILFFFGTAARIISQ
jgi:hypothetical protein